MGSEDDLIRSWDLLCQLGPDRGLHIRVDKCELWSTVDLDRLDTRIKRNDISGLEVLGAALGTPEFVCMKLNERIGKIGVLFEKLDYLDDPQCALGILRHCIGSPKMVYSLRCQTPTRPVIKSLKEFDAQQREKLENILGTVLPEESWTQATLPITLSGLGVRQCQDQYKASYVGSVLSSEDLVSKITGESPKNCQVFQDLYSSIAQLDISNLSQKTIQHSLDNEKFHVLKENLACERESARLLSLSVRYAGAWLSAPPIPALGLHMAPNEFRISAKYRLGVPVYDAERKCPFCKAGVLDIYGDHAIACHGRGDAIARHDRIRDKLVSACSSANLSPVVEKKNLIPESQSCPGDIFVPTWKAGKPAAFDVTVNSSLQSNSLTNAATKAGYALDAADERKYCLHDDNCAKMGITFVPLAIEVFGGISATFKKTLKRLAVLSDNRSFQAQGLSVAFCKLMQSLSITAIRGSAEMLLARAP